MNTIQLTPTWTATDRFQPTWACRTSTSQASITATIEVADACQPYLQIKVTESDGTVTIADHEGQSRIADQLGLWNPANWPVEIREMTTYKVAGIADNETWNVIMLWSWKLRDHINDGTVTPIQDGYQASDGGCITLTSSATGLTLTVDGKPFNVTFGDGLAVPRAFRVADETFSAWQHRHNL